MWKFLKKFLRLEGKEKFNLGEAINDDTSIFIDVPLSTEIINVSFPLSGEEKPQYRNSSEE